MFNVFSNSQLFSIIKVNIHYVENLTDYTQQTILYLHGDNQNYRISRRH